MAEKAPIENTVTCDNRFQPDPLFTGNFIRDTAVSETEKAAEAAQAAYSAIKKKIKREKNKSL